MPAAMSAEICSRNLIENLGFQKPAEAESVPKSSKKAHNPEMWGSVCARSVDLNLNTRGSQSHSIHMCTNCVYTAWKYETRAIVSKHAVASCNHSKYTGALKDFYKEHFSCQS